MKYVQCAKLFDGKNDQMLTEATLVIDGERIARVETGWKAPPDAQVLDLKGLVVLPGLVDAHDHLDIDMGDGESEARQDPQFRAIKAAKNARLVVASGITTLRSAAETHGLGHHVRRAIDAGWIPGPRLVLSGSAVCSTGGHGWFLGIEADGPDEVRRAVRTNIKAGVDMVKMIITGGVTTPGGTLVRTCFTASEIRAACEEARMAGKPIGVHCYGGDAATWAIDAGVDVIEHGTFLTDEQLDRMAERGIWMTSTASVMRRAAAAPHVSLFMRERFQRVSDKYIEMLARARERGIRVACGCDTHHASLADEVEIVSAAGYPWFEALRAVTLSAAQLCTMGGLSGSLEPGKLADFIVVEGDPSAAPAAALRQVREIYKGGIRQEV